MKEKTLGEVIRAARKAKRIPQKELASEVNISAPYLSRIEHGTETLPSKQVLEKISGILGVEYKHLIHLSTINHDPVEPKVFEKWPLEEALNEFLGPDLSPLGVEVVSLHFNECCSSDHDLPRVAHFYRSANEWVASEIRPSSSQGKRKRELLSTPGLFDELYENGHEF